MLPLPLVPYFVYASSEGCVVISQMQRFVWCDSKNVGVCQKVKPVESLFNFFSPGTLDVLAFQLMSLIYILETSHVYLIKNVPQNAGFCPNVYVITFGEYKIQSQIFSV